MDGHPTKDRYNEQRHFSRGDARRPTARFAFAITTPPSALLNRHAQVGVDDCSTDLGLRGLPVFRGLIGPMPEGKTVVRYESPEVFETLTKEWSAQRPRGGDREATQQLA